MDCVVTPLKTLMGFSVHLNVQLKFYNLPNLKQKNGFHKVAIMPSKYTDEIENSSDTWRVFLIMADCKI